MEQTEVNSKNWKSLIKPAKLDVQLSDDKAFAKITAETNQLAAKIKENEVTALKLQGAIETLEYYDDSAASPPEEVDEVTAE